MRSILRATLVAGLLVGCSIGNVPEDPKGSGGAGGGGGTVASGGSGSGGASATGGTSSTGGTLATGGTSATGGSAASGGRSGTGGSSGTGGRSSTGGSTANGGASTAGGTTGTGGLTGDGGVVGSGGRTGTGGATGSGGNTTNDGGPKDGIGQPDLGTDTLATPDTRPDVSSTGDTTGYQPCPTNGDPCKILPLGDSITWGMGDENNAGYRGPLFASVVAAQQNVTFTGSVSNGPSTVSGQTFPKKNEGHSGWTISQIAAQIPNPAMATNSGGVPHIVLLMIGTNDVYAASGQAQMPDRLNTLLDKIVAAAPDALVVVAKITPLSIGNYASTIKTYNDAIPGLVQNKAGEGKHIVLADMNANFPTSLLGDGVHPNTQGYQEMAKRWYAIVGGLLPK